MLSSLLLVPVIFAADPQNGPGRSKVQEDIGIHQADVLGCAHACIAARELQAPPPLLGSTDSLNETDVLHYNLDLEIVPGSNTLIGTNIITVRCVSSGVTKFPLQLHQNFTITAMQVDGVNATFTRLNTAMLDVNLNQTYNANDQFQVRVSYQGVPVSGGFGSINFSTQGGNPLIFTLSEPYYSHTWWPVKEDNRDKATADLAFTVPNTLKVASNGLRQGIDVMPGNKLRYRWKTQYQTAPYLFCFGATNYNEFTDTWTHASVPGGMLMQFFIYPGSDTTTNRNAWLATKQMLTTLSSVYGPYPFKDEKYGIYQFGFSGGMEHQTMTGQGTFSNSVTAHEAGHQWFGDMITCATWSDIWLNEGFATYSEALWLEFQPGSTGTPALLSAMAARRPTSMDTVVYRYDTSSASIIFNSNAVYRKGAWVVHMLRHIVGDPAFFEILAQYRTQFEGSSAITTDFQAVAENVYGSSLNWFFQPWVFQSGAPTYQTAWRNVPAGGQNYFEIYVNQTQNPDWPTFAMPIDVVLTINGSPTTVKVFNDERGEHLLVPVPGTVTAVSIDPNNYILRNTNTTTTFPDGPAKIVQLSPTPGSSTLSTDVSNVSVVFHKTVNAAPAHFILAGDNVGTIPASFNYNAAAKTVTLTPNAPLPADNYTILVSANLTDTATGLALDGEVPNPTSPASLPSGNGMPGGSALMRFTITPVPVDCQADITGDNLVNVADLLAVISSWGPCSGCAADINNDNQVNVSDLLAVISAWGACP